MTAEQRVQLAFIFSFYHLQTVTTIVFIFLTFIQAAAIEIILIHYVRLNWANGTTIEATKRI